MNIAVEVDETKIGKNKYHREYLIKGIWAIGMVERAEEIKRIIIQVGKRDNLALELL